MKEQSNTGVDMTITKLPEQRQPHRKILDLLEPVCEDSLFTSEETLKSCFEAEDFDVAREALSDLEREGSIISRNRSSGTEYALAKYQGQIEAEETEYEALKERVYTAAKRHGLWPKWRQNEGWRLVNGGGKAEAYGNMRVLDEYLHELDANAA
jgi:hypothetical protein